MVVSKIFCGHVGAVTTPLSALHIGCLQHVRWGHVVSGTIGLLYGWGNRTQLIQFATQLWPSTKKQWNINIDIKITTIGK